MKDHGIYGLMAFPGPSGQFTDHKICGGTAGTAFGTKKFDNNEGFIMGLVSQCRKGQYHQK
jgi:hypothetical protein